MRSPFMLIIFIATAFCMELTKLEEESSDPTTINDLASSAPSKKRKSTNINWDQSASKRQNFAGPDATLRPVGYEQQEYHCRQEFTDLIKDSPLEDLHPKKLSLMLRSWERNSDQVLSLATDSKEILDQRKWEELLLDNGTKHQTGEEKRLSSSSRDLCVKIRDRLNLLKEQRLLELGGLYSPSQNQRTFELLKLNHDGDSQMAKIIKDYPEDSVKDIIVRTWGSSGSVLDDIKQIIVDQRSLRKHTRTSGEKTVVPAVKYLFKTMDFLYKQGFLKGEDAKTYVLHDKELVNDLMTYVRASFVNERYISSNYEQIWIGGESAINHWYFSPMHKVFEAFNEKDKQILTLYSLEARILEFVTKFKQSRRQQIPEEFQEIWASFSVPEYIDTLIKYISTSKQSIQYSKKGVIQMEMSVDERDQMKLQIGKMFEILHDVDWNPYSDPYDDYYSNWFRISNASLLYISICQLMDFTEKNFSGGIVEEIESLEKIHSAFGGSRAQRQAALSSSKLVQYMGFTNTLVYLIYDRKSELYLKKNEAHLRSAIQQYMREFSQEMIEFKKNHDIVGVDQTIFGDDANDFFDSVALHKEHSTDVFESALQMESLDIRKYISNHM
ncbi:hypothetical protein PSTG_07728 [Puccinia striiformis f. sp. tritici PST-78]|uniref:Uncharacterized protein n=1 Tax=Puccinia striiformis f. sp. tritici PST-78 TaxID=1165861 RepID=A0A0L0VIF7_9BASI|nr:hypothetical protein PSTG_07728 [Puccinia striiformis f. sp. tritici PST-78]